VVRADEYYYSVRERFNSTGSPYDFLLLNRACFNGLMRFNRHGHFNVPFCRKPGRFSPSYITKIVNQVNWVSQVMRNRDWEFRVVPWEDTLEGVEDCDFVYADPPYVGRHGDYYNTWEALEAKRLASAIRCLPCGFAVSMWRENRYRGNAHVADDFAGLEVRCFSHFYHIGATEDLRNEMSEALIVRPGFSALAEPPKASKPHAHSQLVSQATFVF
jgi:DNA adenine methylase